MTGRGNEQLAISNWQLAIGNWQKAKKQKPRLRKKKPHTPSGTNPCQLPIANWNLPIAIKTLKNHHR
jgi:hypothetical protein